MIVTLAEARTYLGLASTITDADLGLLNLVMGGAHAAVRKYLKYDPEYKASRTEYYPRFDERPDADKEGYWDSDGTTARWTSASSHSGGVLCLQHLPVRQIMELYEDQSARHGTADGAWAAETRLSEGVDFYPEYEQSGVCLSGIVRRVTGSWPSTPGTVKVVYEAGYTPQELNVDSGVFDAREIKEGCLLAVERAFKTRKLQQKQPRAGWVAGPLTSESLGEYSYTAGGASFFNLSAYLTPETKEKLNDFRNMAMMVL